jgi:uncharacterized protein (TIGR03118 family)
MIVRADDSPKPPAFIQTNLISDLSGKAMKTDPSLINPWGMTFGLNGGVWISANGSGTSVTYDGKGQPITPQTVIIPSAGESGGTSSPTGVATNPTPGFVIVGGGTSAPGIELFATEDGTIAAWNRTVNATSAVIVVDNSASGAVYKGLALGYTAAGDAFLFATNFSAGTIDVFDSKFHSVNTHGKFADPQIPAGYAPFGISVINAQLYVSYAMQDEDMEDDVPGAGHGFVDVFDTDGNLVKRFASKGQLNSPWGMAWTPFEAFGSFDNALLVGNFGDGTINAFDFDSGDFIGKVMDANGTPIKIPGVWALQFGLAVANSSSSTLFFTAGIQDEQHGLFGTLTVDPSSLPSPEGPVMTDASLQVKSVVSGLDQPTSMAFLAPNDFLILEKASGKVKHVVNGSSVSTVLTLPVNSASERGLLGIALQPDFANTHGVYLYWTQSLSGRVSTDLADVPLLGNRVDRFLWNPVTQTLTQDRNIIRLHSFQADAGQPMRGNHNGGKILFGPDGKLYFQIGDQGRRGQMQNLPSGPFGPGKADDQFGGPAPDDAHLTGVIFRLNADGSVPDDNPFAKVTVQEMEMIEQQAGVTLTPDQLTTVVANIHKIYSYGRRNGFGLAFDPMTGLLWESENGDDAMDEVNQITAGSNGGWIQIHGLASRLADFKGIESSFTPLQGNVPTAGNVPLSPIDPNTLYPGLQQIRWSPTLISDSASVAMSRLFVLPGSHYEDPEFCWKWAVAPAAIGFAGSALGPQHAGNLFVGGSRTFLDEGYLFEFQFDAGRQHFLFSDSALKGKIDDNDYKFDEGNSTSLVAGKNFGVVTDILTGPDGNLYVSSLSNGAVYMIR